MKKSIQPLILLLLVCGFAAITGCQHPVLTTPQQQILGKWTMVDGISKTVFVQPHGVNTNDTTKFTAADYFNFKADSTVDIMQGGVSYNGKWKMVGNAVIFTGTNYMDIPTTGWMFPILTTTTLQFYHQQVDSYDTADFKLDFKR